VEPEKVAFHAVLPNPDFPRKTARPPRLAERLRVRLSKLQRWKTKEAARYVFARRSDALKGIKRGTVKSLSDLRLRLGKIRQQASQKQPDDLEQILRVLGMAAEHYQPPHYSGRVALFLCVEEAARSGQEARSGWGQVIADLQVYEVPGGHMTMMTEPHVDTLGNKLSACLGEVRELTSTVRAAGE